ncbi:MAG: nitrogenase iron-molybdenum cofactor biosynthesis protein NifN, partial [Nitrospirae bacterium]|nr:nitrogenase iron-molybdenum cofactor biosynthesis protein NifN [Nitrospirota bacterium]
TLHAKAKPALIGLCTTGLTEIRGDDVEGVLKNLRAKHPELNDLAVVHVSTPDFKGSFEDGWAKAVTALIDALVEPPRKSPPSPLFQRGDGGGISEMPQVNLLAGCHLTPSDIEELREIMEAFGLKSIFLPDLSGSLDGHVPDDFSPTTLGGSDLEWVREMGSAEITLAVGESMRPAAAALEAKAGVPFVVFDRLTGLDATDRFLDLLSKISGRAVPDRLRRQRSRLVDAMLDGHFYFGKKKVAVGAEPDLLHALSAWFTEMGCEVRAAVAPVHSPVLERVPASEVRVGDLEDLESLAAGCDLIVANSHGRQASRRMGIPLFRVGIPIFDRLGAAHRLSVGYRGTMRLIFEVGNLFLESVGAPFMAPRLDESIPCHAGRPGGLPLREA